MHLSMPDPDHSEDEARFLLLGRTFTGRLVVVVFTFSPCGSVRTLEFMKWLGISFPRWLENELRHSADPLERSIDLCESVLQSSTSSLST